MDFGNTGQYAVRYGQLCFGEANERQNLIASWWRRFNGCYITLWNVPAKQLFTKWNSLARKMQATFQSHLVIAANRSSPQK